MVAIIAWGVIGIVALAVLIVMIQLFCEMSPASRWTILWMTLGAAALGAALVYVAGG